jgi:hypothetical protein
MDFAFLLKAFRAANVVYVDKTLGNYRMYGDNKTTLAFATTAGWEMITRVLRKHVAQQNVLYRLHVGLGMVQLRESLTPTENISLARRLRRRSVILCQKVLDPLLAQVEKFGG